MAYIDDITNPLIRVLTCACDGGPERFAGYASNADFWMAEAAHCLHVLKGYRERFGRFHGADSSATPTSTASQVSALRQKLFDVSRRFLKRCEQMKLINNEELVGYAARLSIHLPL